MNRKDERPSKIAYEKHLNEEGVPEDNKKSNGGIIPDYVKYGTWLRVNDPDLFETGYREWQIKMRSKMEEW